MILPFLFAEIKFWLFKYFNWCEIVVWFIFNRVEMSLTHISHIARQEIIFRRVASEKT